MASLNLTTNEPTCESLKQDAANLDKAPIESQSETASQITTSDDTTVIEDNTTATSSHTEEKPTDPQEAKKIKAKEKKKRHEKQRKARRKAEKRAQGDAWVPLRGGAGQQNGGKGISSGGTGGVITAGDDEDVDEVVPFREPKVEEAVDVGIGTVYIIRPP